MFLGTQIFSLRHGSTDAVHFCRQKLGRLCNCSIKIVVGGDSEYVELWDCKWRYMATICHRLTI